MTKFKKNMARRKKFDNFLKKYNLVTSGCGFNGNILVFRKKDTSKVNYWHIGVVTSSYIKSIDLNIDLICKDFDFL